MNEVSTIGLFAGVSANQLAMLGGAIVLLTFVMISTRRRLRESRALTGRPARERYADMENREVVRRDVDQVMLELDSLARQVHARIDTRLARLEALIRDADRRIDVLSKQPRAVKQSPAADRSSSERVGSAIVKSAAPMEDDRFRAVYRLADRGMEASQIAERVDRPEGEIELILGLRKARSGASQSPAVGASGSKA